MSDFYAVVSGLIFAVVSIAHLTRLKAIEGLAGPGRVILSANICIVDRSAGFGADLNLGIYAVRTLAGCS
jgi:hypothetical protein